MRHKVTKNLAGFLTLALAISASAYLLSCGGSDSPTNPGGGGGGGGGGGATTMFDSGNLSLGQSFTFVFTNSEIIPYYCQHHGTASGTGMAGSITVSLGGTPSSQSFSINSSSLPSFSIDIGDTVTWTNNHAGFVHTVQSAN